MMMMMLQTGSSRRRRSTLIELAGAHVHTPSPSLQKKYYYITAVVAVSHPARRTVATRNYHLVCSVSREQKKDEQRWQRVPERDDEKSVRRYQAWSVAVACANAQPINESSIHTRLSHQPGKYHNTGRWELMESFQCTQVTGPVVRRVGH